MKFTKIMITKIFGAIWYLFCNFFTKLVTIRSRCSNYSVFATVCSKKDLRKALEEIGEQVSETQLRELIAEVDVNQNSTIEEEEFLMVSNQIM